MAERDADGRIITFYSFKGGVGRTMALANVAFLTALNGYRVLVMDWDLEAPGLHYYLRGLMEAPEANALKECRGVLDIVWDWSASASSAGSPSDVEALIERYQGGGPFAESVCSVLDEFHLPTGGVLDFIGAGAPIVNTPQPLPYEDALANFSWPKFFERDVGGLVLESLRRWAKTHYDYVFIDSRTGLADVAGICTMQLPDTVALTFILNRQNIDGVARVAHAIRDRREEQIDLRAVPMRVGNGEGQEEADARARAIQALTKVGGFASDVVQADFKLLSVRSTQDVPFYETLAPFRTAEPRLDPLVLNYLSLANNLVKRPLEIFNLDPIWVEQVRRRLQPKHATIDYVNKLKTADPERALDEIEGLIENAFEAALDDQEINEDYIYALVDAALVMIDNAESYRVIPMMDRTVDLLRTLAANQPAPWSEALANTLGRYIDEAGYFLDPESQLTLLEELDGLLAKSNSLAVRLTRLDRRRIAARLYVESGNIEGATQTIGEIRKFISDIQKAGLALSAEQSEELLVARIDSHLQRARVYNLEPLRLDHVAPELRLALDALPPLTDDLNLALRRLGLEINALLARPETSSVSDEEKAVYAVEAARWGGGTGGVIFRFAELAAAIGRAPNARALALEFCRLIFEDNRGLAIQLSHYFGRQPHMAIAFFRSATALVTAIGRATTAADQHLVGELVSAAENVGHGVGRRRFAHSEERSAGLTEHVLAFARAVQNAGAAPEVVGSLQNLAQSFNPRGLRPRDTDGDV